MSTAADLSAKLLSTNLPAVRERLYEQAERDYGKNFADHLRDQVEAHHLIVSNERASSR